MSAPIDDGGSAFPTQDKRIEGFGVCFDTGMTLRDYFACKALHGMCSNGTDWSIYQPEKLAKAVYRIADAMIEARKEAK